MDVVTTFYDLTPVDAEGRPFHFTQLEGKVVLIVNTASGCGFTSQYRGLETLYNKYKDQGLVVLGFPSNQFANQEPGTNEEIQAFCQSKYQITFPVLSKVKVNGAKTDPVYQYLKNHKPGLLGLSRIKWNFEKFLINKKGEVVSRYVTTKKPGNLEPEIKKLLAE